MSEIRKWLEGIGLGEYADAFEANHIDMDLLQHVEDQTLKDIGIASAGHRLILYEDLDEIVLVGFSYGGYAFVPSNGETVWSHIGREARAKIELGQDWLVTGPVRKYDSPAEAEWMAARRTTHPQGCFTEPVFLSQPLESFPCTRTYIKATQAPENDIGNEAFWRAARHAKGSPAWR